MPYPLAGSPLTATNGVKLQAAPSRLQIAATRSWVPLFGVASRSAGVRIFNGSVVSTPTPPTTGQLWPRGGGGGASGPAGSTGSDAVLIVVDTVDSVPPGTPTDTLIVTRG